MRFLLSCLSSMALVSISSVSSSPLSSIPLGYAPYKPVAIRAASPSQCNIPYSQSVTLNGNLITARFTPSSGATMPTFVDFHVSKNCPGNPQPSSGVCSTPWYQPPFDENYALNVHASGVGAFSMTGASFNGKDFLFEFDISTLALTSSDKLCYDFTYVFDSLGCDTGVCSLSPPTAAPFILPTTCDALTYTQDVAINGNHILAHFIPDAGKPIPTWVDLHVSKNCPGNPYKSNSTCATPWYQPPFDEAYALNLHASQSATSWSTPGATFLNGQFIFDFDATTLLSTIGGSDVFCYDFTYAYGNLGCDSGVCSLLPPPPPTTSPIVVGQPSCSQVTYTQSVTITGASVLATFTPTTGSVIPTFVDFHISKNCPGNPTTASGQCATPWNQPPFDETFALNLHNSAVPGTYSSAGAVYDPATHTFTFMFDGSHLLNTLSSSDKLCYDFTYVLGNYGCDTGICAVVNQLNAGN